MQTMVSHLSYTARGDFTGKGVHVYMIDSGITAGHEVFKTTNINQLFSFDGSYVDDMDHGTGVAGMITSVARECVLHNLKIINGNGNMGLSAILKAIDHIILHHDKTSAGVVCIAGNMSDNKLLGHAINELISHNLVVVGAGANEYLDNRSLTPANHPGVLTVGAYNRAYEVAAAHKRSPYAIPGQMSYNSIDIFALGIDVEVPTKHGYDYRSGTSIAAGIVTGMCALYIQKFKNLDAKTIKYIIESEGKSFENDRLIFPHKDETRAIIIMNSKLTSVPAGRIADVKLGDKLTVDLGLNEEAVDVKILDFAPTPPWVSFDATSGLVEIDSASAPEDKVAGVFLFAIRGQVDGDVIVDEFSIGLYKSDEKELSDPSIVNYYYDNNMNDYDAIVTYVAATSVKP